jgi:hypothetical protein
MVAHSRAPVRPDRLRALNLPSAVAVELDERGLPTAVVDNADDRGAEGQRGRSSSGRVAGTYNDPSIRRSAERKVEEICEVWRVDDEWWRTPIARRYVEVVLEGGSHVVLFEDLVSNTWFLQMP